MRLSVEIHEVPGGAPTRVIAAERFPLRIGRGPESHVRLDDESVSAVHAEIAQDGAAFVVRDLGSLNGTHVGGERLPHRASRLVTDGAWIGVGRFELVARIEPEMPSKLGTAELAMRLLEDGAIRTVPVVVVVE